MVIETDFKFLPNRRPLKLRRITIEVTTWCNLKCVGCLRTIRSEKGDWINSHMALATFSRILDNLPGAGVCNLQGIGEPTLHPHYMDLCRIAKASGKFDSLYANTNAIQRDPDYYLALLEAGLTGFYVSVDSLTQEIADIVRAGTDVEKLKSRMSRMAALGIPVSAAMVVSKMNFCDVAVTLRSFHELGLTSALISRFIDFEGRGWALDLQERKRLAEIVEQAKKQCPGMAIAYYDEGERIAPFCVAPWFDPAINVDGYLTPCCVNFDPKTFDYQDLASKTFEDAWHSEPVQRFLESYIQTNPAFCHGCLADVRG